MGVGQLDHLFEVTCGYERVEMDVTELCNAESVEFRRQAVECNINLADNDLMRLVETRSERAAGEHNRAKTKKFTPRQ